MDIGNVLLLLKVRWWCLWAQIIIAAVNNGALLVPMHHICRMRCVPLEPIFIIFHFILLFLHFILLKHVAARILTSHPTASTSISCLFGQPVTAAMLIWRVVLFSLLL